MKNNRTGGHNSERKWVALFATYFSLEAFQRNNIATAQIGTTRQFSAALDAKKIDVWIARTTGKLARLAMQIKKKVVRGNSYSIDIQSLLEMQTEYPTDFRILVNHLKRKPKTKEQEIGWYVTMPAEDFLRLINEWKNGDTTEILHD